jgi:hypothetical protein
VAIISGRMRWVTQVTETRQTQGQYYKDYRERGCKGAERI